MSETVFTSSLAFLLPLLIGLACSALLSTRRGSFWLLVWLAPGIGMGCTAVLFFLWSLIFYPGFQPWLYATLECLLLTGLLAVLWRVRAQVRFPRPVVCLGLFGGLVAAAFLAMALFFSYRFWLYTGENPLGSSDAWTIWNLRARFLLLGDPQSWRSVFSAHLNHSDYPFLLSGFISRCWVLMGKDRAAVPVLTAGLYALSTVGLLSAAVTRLRGLASGLLAGILLMSLPVFTWTSASQYADLPLAFYFLACLVLILLYITEDQAPVYLFAAGWMAAFGLWTKNEGASFLLSTALVLGALALFHKGTRQQPSLRRILPFAAGLMPVLLVYLGFKVWLAPANDLFEQRQWSDLARLVLDPARYGQIGAAVGTAFFNWGGWKVPFLPSVIAFTLAAGLQPLLKREKLGIRAVSGILALTYIQYLAIYLITPHDLAWHLQSSIARLYSQLLPGFLLVMLLITRPVPDLHSPTKT